MNKRVNANGKRSKPQQHRPDMKRGPDSRSERLVEESDEDEPSWTPTEGGALYQIHGWGSPYFSVAENGHVVVTPDPLRSNTVDLHELVNNLRARGLGLPLLIRFPDILGDRIRQINEAFETAIKEYNYPASYQGVFPVKVNQQRHLVEDIVQRGEHWRFGLEAGRRMIEGEGGLPASLRFLTDRTAVLTEFGLIGDQLQAFDLDNQDMEAIQGAVYTNP